MPVRSIFLRTLLAVCLVLNGTGTAVAAVQMGTAAIPGEVTAPEAGMRAMASDAGCHDRQTPVGAAHGDAMEHDDPGTPHRSTDCCKYGACQCACAQQAQGVPAALAPQAFIEVPGVALHALADGRAAPVPDALLRPPIA